MAVNSTGYSSFDSLSRSAQGKQKTPPTVVVDQNDADEEQPLLADRNPKELETKRLTAPVMFILLMGELLAHADTTLIFAAAPHIASELGNLGSMSWLSVAYTLAVCSTQPLYGRLSDIFGRKEMLLFAYIVLVVGCTICGFSVEMWQIILGRAVSGIGGAGIMTMASIIITDSVPKREFASYRSYINLATTLGRSIGAPIGGVVADQMGWSWLFLLRIPFFILSATLVILFFRPPHSAWCDSNCEEGMEKLTLRQKMDKVDFRGAFLLAKTIICLILLLDRAQHGFQQAGTLLLFVSVLVFGQFFVFWELWGTSNPIFDLRIMVRPNVAVSYVIDYLQVLAQVGMMFSVPLYFQVTQRSSVAASGVHLVPAVVANTIGSLASGKLVRRFSRSHRVLVVCTGLIGSVTYILLFTRWNGSVDWIESLYIMPAGFATGMAQSVSFVTMASFLEQSSIAMATGWFFLCSSLGTASGVTITNVLVQVFYSKFLRDALADGPGKADLIRRLTSDIESIGELDGSLHATAVKAFVGSLKTTYAVGFTLNVLTSCLGVLIKQADL